MLLFRCVSLTKSFATIEKLKLSGSSQSDDLWKWVGYNDPDAIINTRETTSVAIVIVTMSVSMILQSCG